jgi:asparagine synthase (glutamine-hydrolysing)
MSDFIKEDIMISKLFHAIKDSIGERLTDDSVISFSGGIDSSIIASISSFLGHDPTLITVGTKDSKDVENAIRMAKALNLKEPFIRVLDRGKIREALLGVMQIIKNKNPVQVAIATPFYFACKTEKEGGFEKILTGQGADELFGGYDRYKYMGEREFEEALRDDVINITKDIKRDRAIARSQNLTLKAPYLDRRVIKVASDIPVDLKIKRDAGLVIRKYILKRLAEERISKELTGMEKKAMQYGSGVWKIMKKMAKDSGKGVGEFLSDLEDFDD